MSNGKITGIAIGTLAIGIAIGFFIPTDSGIEQSAPTPVMHVTTEYLTRAVFVKQWTALHVVRTTHLFSRYVFISLTKMRTETKTVPST